MDRSKKGKNRKRARSRPPAAPAKAEAEAKAEVKAAEVHKRPPRRGATGTRRPDPAARRPDPPWGSLPLSEVLVLAGIAFLVWGLVGQNTVSMVVGLGLASLGGLELSVREHLGGYRSHTSLLASAAALIVLAVTYYAVNLAAWASLALGVVTFASAFVLWRRAFKAASGGYSFRIGGFRG